MLNSKYHLLLFTSILTALFTLLAWPGLTGPVPAAHGAELVAVSRPATDITFSSVATLYLPIVIKPVTPVNDVRINALVYSGGDEYVEIKNVGPAAQLLDGWRIVSVRGTQTYNFPSGITLGVGATARVHSGPAAFDSPPADLLWSTDFLWNNEGDQAELRDDQGKLRSTSCYNVGCQ
jgi:competence protein ComEC